MPKGALPPSGTPTWSQKISEANAISSGGSLRSTSITASSPIPGPAVTTLRAAHKRPRRFRQYLPSRLASYFLQGRIGYTQPCDSRVRPCQGSPSNFLSERLRDLNQPRGCCHRPLMARCLVTAPHASRGAPGHLKKELAGLPSNTVRTPGNIAS